MTTTTLNAERLAEARAWAGYRSAAFNRETGTLVAVLHAGEAAIEDDPDVPWATLCDDHGGLCLHPTLALAKAHASSPTGWCGGCADAREALR